MTHQVDWLTYSWSEGLGLSDWLARFMNLPKGLDLLEASNDSTWTAKVGPEVAETSEQSYREATWEDTTQTGWVTCWDLPYLMQAAYERGHLPEGMYVVKVSW